MDWFILAQEMQTSMPSTRRPVLKHGIVVLMDPGLLALQLLMMASFITELLILT